MANIRAAAFVLTLAGLGGGLAAPAAMASPAASVTTPVLTGIRAAHHPGYDRLVFQFRGRLPATRRARYVLRVIADGSGKRVHLAGSAFLRVAFFPAIGHTATGGSSYGPGRRTFALPGLIQVANAGDFEVHLSFGVGVARREPFRLFILRDPSRVVIDLQTPYTTTGVRDYFLDTHRFAHGKPPYTRAVTRPVTRPAVGFGALQRLFAGPTLSERAVGLRFIASKATGFTHLTIGDHVARVQLIGGCNSGASTFTIANEIRPTLRQFPSVRWVKIYDPAGHTERPHGHTDSIPACLEP
jgi:hypothetical protein